ncbi:MULTISPECIES: RraA family protein [Variovorax]|jgi:regulator of RNase E activity RraA|uniref:RraA family protein n=1 Tax=Variovorax TaxID=34072 RepID=UPI00086BC641|nr:MULTISPECIES: RraA family protein [Variovorax]MBN8757806.1 RraA family protein [Variovorax sp.]ODU18064.1 MAG: methyltransferase [Variovorax sp. SCN 67-85]ODV24599.1 MAG: methyltransferase [Variovorax sp. SCN 67-20]OJZ13463.1 MAG: methyltransferase [Variovorax sp. 67-131]UKI06106.1 RraA family protein [Variovorax paradoxus]
MPYKAIRKNPSAPQVAPAILAALQDIPVAALSDNLHRNIGSVGLQPYHRPGRKTMAGTAVTVKTRGGDNLTPMRAFEFCRPGDVLVIDAGGDVTNAVIGGILSFYTATIGTAGLVLDGAIRDVAEIRERDYPVYARGVNHRGPYKDGPGEINVPVSVGGMVVNPGDIVVGDQDGLLAFSPDEAELLIEKARAHLETEARTIQAMKEGRWDRSFLDALEARCAN